MSVHPDKTAIRAVDACGGSYSAAEIASRFAEGHSAALCEAMKAVVDADALTAELLEALRQLLANAEVARLHLRNDEGGNIIGSALWDTIGQAERAIATATRNSGDEG